MLKRNRKNSFTTIGLLLTAFILVGHVLLPDKRLTLYPKATIEPEVYGDVDAEHGPSAQWLNEEAGQWRCRYQASHSFGCGWQTIWDPAETTGIDLRQYEAMELQLDYQGPARRLRIFLRNFDPIYADIDNLHTTKFMSITFPVEEAQAPVRIDLTEFAVGTWWLRAFNIQSQWALPDFHHITHVGLEVVEPGEHELRVARLTLIGPWISTKALLSGILAFWLTVFLIHGLSHFVQLYRRSQRERGLIRSLKNKQRKLEEENNTLEVMADTDPLTGVLNRTGLQSHINSLFEPTGAQRECGIILLDIDHFKCLNDTYGHDMGDKVLKAFATIIAANLRTEDVFARWGGEEFILLCQNNSAHSLRGFADKLRIISASCTYGADLNLTITISAGLTIARPGEPFETTFKRADKALHKAKQCGRNRVEYDHED